MLQKYAEVINARSGPTDREKVVRNSQHVSSQIRGTSAGSSMRILATLWRRELKGNVTGL